MTGPWRCDTCWNPIEPPRDWVVQWHKRSVGGRIEGRDLGIVHHMAAGPLGGPDGCHPEGVHGPAGTGFSLAGHRLDGMIGPDGLVRLLALAVSGEVPAPKVHRVIMRLFVPNYEQARWYFEEALDAAIASGVQRARATGVRARYVDVSAEFAGHGLSDRSSPWVNGVVLASLGACLIGMAVLTLFVGAMRDAATASILFACFGAALVCTVAAIGAFMTEILMAGRGVRDEVEHQQDKVPAQS